MSLLGPPPGAGDQDVSDRAIRHGQRLAVDDPIRLSAKLYFYGRRPATPELLAGFCTPASVIAHLGVSPDGDTQWQPFFPDEQAGGSHWCVLRRRSGGSRRSGAKLYITIKHEYLRPLMRTILRVAAINGASAVKLPFSAHSLVRPDHLMLYFANVADARQAANAMWPPLRTEAPGDPAWQSLPFSAPCFDHPSPLYWGVDPPGSESRVAWLEQESWRLRLTNQIALAILQARRSLDDSKMVRSYVKLRLEINGICTRTWTQRGRFTSEMTNGFS